MKKLVLVGLVTGVVSGCASVPPVTMGYYPARVTSTVSVTQTIQCYKDKTGIVVVNSTPAITTLYGADTTKGPYTVSLDDIGGTFADTDFTFTYYDDGRLKTVNASTTGQGEAAIKSAVTLASAFVKGFRSLSLAPIPQCEFLETWYGNKPVTLTYSSPIDLTKDGVTDLKPLPGSSHLHAGVKEKLPMLRVVVGPRTTAQSGAHFDPKADRDVVNLTLQETENVRVEVVAETSEDGKPAKEALAAYNVIVPGDGEYVLPIPKAALFGTQTFTLTLSEAGAVQSIGYKSTGGTAAASNTATTIGNALAPESTQTKVNELKAQADLIAAQQRLARCQADPVNCK